MSVIFCDGSTTAPPGRPMFWGSVSRGYHPELQKTAPPGRKLPNVEPPPQSANPQTRRRPLQGITLKHGADLFKAKTLKRGEGALQSKAFCFDSRKVCSKGFSLWIANQVCTNVSVRARALRYLAICVAALISMCCGTDGLRCAFDSGNRPLLEAPEQWHRRDCALTLTTVPDGLRRTALI